MWPRGGGACSSPVGHVTLKRWGVGGLVTDTWGFRFLLSEGMTVQPSLEAAQAWLGGQLLLGSPWASTSACRL